MSLLEYQWKQIGWENFEKMCLYLAECVWPERRFELYGRAGEEQEGIDIISKNEKGETLICLQCKRYDELDAPTLKKIIQKFEEGEFVQNANTFVIVTRASLNSAKHLNFINREKARFKDKYKISFESWDVNYIEKELSNHYTLTSKYFGIEVAEMIWSGRTAMPLAYLPVNDYIERSIVPYRVENTDRQLQWMSNGGGLLRLVDLFTKNLSGDKRYCLLADAYQGKTTLFKQLAYELFYHPLKLKPVFLRLKEYDHRSLIETLDNSHRWWRSVPIKELIIIIDGLDEVDAGRFLDAVKNINKFSQRFPSLTIIFSCRKLFFHHSELQDLLKEFSYYELYQLQEPEVAEYLTRLLPGQDEPFRKYVEAYDLGHFLYHPFYLRSLVRIFKTDRRNLPKSRAATIEYFLKESFDTQSSRELKGGQILKRKQQHYIMLLKKAAFAMQLRGQNILLDEEVQLLFPTDEDIELLKLGSVLTFSHDKWSFENAIFQEYLSALVLKGYLFRQIENIICVGKKIKKIRTKWIQTLVGLLSLLPTNDDRRSSLLDLLRKDNIELLVLCDGQMLSPQDRLNILQQLLQRYQEKNLRPMVVGEDNIGRFFRSQSPAIEVMFDVLGQTGETEIKKIVWRILQFVDLPLSYQDQMLVLAEKEILQTKNGLYVNDILYTLTQYQMGTQAFVDFLINQHELNDQPPYRDGVYSMIVQLNLGDIFYDYGLDGIKLRGKTPAHNSTRSEHSLERMLLSASTVKCITKLFGFICSEECTDFPSYTYSGNESFMLRLANLCKQIYDNDSLMVLSVLRFVRCLGRKHLWNDMKEIDQFFFQSGTTSFAIRYLIHLPFPYVEVQLGKLLTEEAFDLLFDYHENGYIKLDKLQILVENAHFEGDKAVSDSFNELYIAATYAEDIILKIKEQHHNREAYEQKKRQNDLVIIQNQSSFAEGLKNYFEDHCERSSNEKELLLDYRESQ